MICYIDIVEDLEVLYGKFVEVLLIKVVDCLMDVYCDWVMVFKFCIISIVGLEGIDVSFCGDVMFVV